MGIWAPLGIYVLRFTSIVIPALPSTAYSILAGGLLGFEKGLTSIVNVRFLQYVYMFLLLFSNIYFAITSIDSKIARPFSGSVNLIP